MSNAMPKFNFSQSTIKTEEELQSLLGEEGGGRQYEDKYFKPGTHQVTIKAVVYQGTANDDSWGKFLLTLEGTNGKTMTDQVLVPLQGPVFTSAKSGKNTGYPYKKFKNVMGALGINITVPTLEAAVIESFSAPDTVLVGRSVSANMGYDGNSIGYGGKDEAGIKLYNITMKDGSTLSNAAGQTITFPERAAAVEYAEHHNIQLSYVNVLSYNAGEAVVDSAW